MIACFFHLGPSSTVSTLSNTTSYILSSPSDTVSYIAIDFTPAKSKSIDHVNGSTVVLSPSGTTLVLSMPSHTRVPVSSNILDTSTDSPISTSIDSPTSTSIDSPISTSTDGPISTSTDGPISTSTDGPISTSTDGPISTSTDGPISTSTDGRISTSHLFHTPSFFPTISPPSPDSNTDDNTTVVIFAGVVGGLIVCIVLVLILIGICLFMKKNRRSKTELKKLQNAMCEEGVELKDAEKNEGNADNPHYPSSQNDNGHQPNTAECPLYHSAEVTTAAYYSMPPELLSPGDDELYTVVGENRRAAVKAVNNHSNGQNASTFSSLAYKSISPPPQETPPIYSSIQKELPPDIPQRVPELSAECNGTDAQEKAPLLATKSEEYLARNSAGSWPTDPLATKKPSKISALPLPLISTMRDNPTYESADGISDDALSYSQPGSPSTVSDSEAIYSEAIDPSLFIRQRLGEGEREDSQIYSSIYTIPAALPENLQRPLEVNSDNIIEKKELGIGQFGKVVLAYTNGLSMKDMGFTETESNWDISIQVAVKRLKSHASKPQREAFDKEIKFMSRLKHPNVVRFIGVCHRDPAFIMMEYMEEGDLSQFLQRYTEILESPSNDTQISTSTVVHMTCQIASAMKYLASLNFVHRDLACRNCLVGKKFTVKLADFGMSRNLYESHYYRIQGNAVLPIRWMATECFYGKFSEKTDVWSFGITIWELFTLGKNKPYPHLTDQEVIKDATTKGKHRQLLSKPAACPDSVYDVMQQCWAANPKKRVMFSAIDEMLQECQ